MRLLCAFILFLLLGSCKKGNDLSGGEKGVLVPDFLYVNPKGEALSDSIIFLPSSHNVAPENSDLQFYIGAQFVSNTRRENNDGRWVAFEEMYINWKVRDVISNKIVREGNEPSLLLRFYELGKYKLTQYVYSSSENRDRSIDPVDSVSKTLIVHDLLQIDSISVENFSFNSPYLNRDLIKSRPVNAFVSIYENENSVEKGDEPSFKTELLKDVKVGAESLKFGIPANRTISKLYVNNADKGNCLIQFNVVQDGINYTIIDNKWGLIFKNLIKGYYSDDKSKLLNEQTLRFGDMKLKIWTSYRFME